MWLPHFFFLAGHNSMDVKTVETHALIFLSLIILDSAGVHRKAPLHCAHHCILVLIMIIICHFGSCGPVDFTFETL